MASDESVITICEDDHDFDVYDHHHQHHSLSRLSICSNNSKNISFYGNGYEEDDDDDDDSGDMSMFMSQLSIECSDGDADEELSDDDDDDDDIDVEEGEEDDDKHRKVASGEWTDQSDKDFSPSENETVRRSSGCTGSSLVRNSSRRSRLARERWLERAWEKKKYRAEGMMMSVDDGDSMTTIMDQSNTPTSIASPTRGNSSAINTASNHYTGSGVESDHQQHHCLLITRPNGGRRSLCMDMEEVRACRDLGFDLEHERLTLEIPSRSRVSMSSSTIDTSSGGNSPIANWKISSPGDDPRDIKARLKVWAQAVALASASHLC